MSQSLPLWRIYADLLAAWALLGIAPGAAAALSPEDHRFLAERYAQLAARWRRVGWRAHADALAAKAERHIDAAGGDDLRARGAAGAPCRAQPPRCVGTCRTTRAASVLGPGSRCGCIALSTSACFALAAHPTMTAPHPLSVRGKMLAFRYAWQGVAYMLRTQPNAWFQIGVWITVTAVGLAFGLTRGRVVRRGAGDGAGLDHRGAQHGDRGRGRPRVAGPSSAGRPRQGRRGRARCVVAVAASAIVGLIIFGPRFWALLPR